MTDLTELQEMLAKVGESLDKPLPAIDVPTVEGEGTSEDQMVTITVSGGQVSGVRIDPRSMRKSSVELADDIRAATNAAIEAHSAALMQAMQGNATSPADLRTELDGVRDEAVKSLGDYLDAMTAMMESAAAKQE